MKKRSQVLKLMSLLTGSKNKRIRLVLLSIIALIIIGGTISTFKQKNVKATNGWSIASPAVTGDDKKDDQTGLIWSHPLFLNSEGQAEFNSLKSSGWNQTGTFTLDVFKTNPGGKGVSVSPGAIYTNNNFNYAVKKVYVHGSMHQYLELEALSGLPVAGALYKYNSSSEDPEKIDYSGSYVYQNDSQLMLFQVNKITVKNGAKYITGSKIYEIVGDTNGGYTIIVKYNSVYTGSDDRYLKPRFGILTKISGTGDETIKFNYIVSGQNNIVASSKTAESLCSEKGNGWRLPTKDELIEAYNHGAVDNLSQFHNVFWSSSVSESNNRRNQKFAVFYNKEFKCYNTDPSSLDYSNSSGCDYRIRCVRGQ